MNRLEKKTMVTLLTAIFMISIFTVVIPVSAQKGWGPPELIVHASGEFTVMHSFPAPSEPYNGDECFVTVTARLRNKIGSFPYGDLYAADGKGIYRDYDYGLNAKLKVDKSDYYEGSNEAILHGKAYVDGDAYDFDMIINPTYLSMQIPDLLYFVYVYGTNGLNTFVNIPE